MKADPVIIAPREGIYVSVVGDTYRVVVSGDQTGNDFAVIDMSIPKGGGPPPHAHAGFHETFYVMEGEIEVRSEAGHYTAKKGSCVVIPKGGIVHQFMNIKEEVAQLLCIVVPAGLEQMFLEVGTPVKAGSFLPPDPGMIPRLKAVAEKYGQELYPPDYLEKLGGT